MKVSSNFYKSYCNGFSQFCNNKNDSKTKVIGLLKIISYCTLLIPAIVLGVLYPISLLCGRVNKNPNPQQKPTISKISRVSQKLKIATKPKVDPLKPIVQEPKPQDLLKLPEQEPKPAFKHLQRDILFPYSIKIATNNDVKDIDDTYRKASFPYGIIEQNNGIEDSDRDTYHDVYLPKPIKSMIISELTGFIAHALGIKELSIVISTNYFNDRNIFNNQNEEINLDFLSTLKDAGYDENHIGKLGYGVVFPPRKIENCLNDLIRNLPQSPYPHFWALEDEINYLAKQFYGDRQYEKMYEVQERLEKVMVFLESLVPQWRLQIKDQIKNGKKDEKFVESLRSIYYSGQLIMVWTYTMSWCSEIYRKATEFPEIEKILEEFPWESCKPQNEKPTFQIELDIDGQVITETFDKEHLFKQSPYFKASGEFTPDAENVVALEETSMTVFKLMVIFLNEGDLSWAEYDEDVLIDLYDLASQLSIPRLQALCAQEIAHRLMLQKWQNMKLLDLYKDNALLAPLF